MGPPFVVDALPDQGMMPTANPVIEMRRVYANMDDDVRPQAEAALHKERRAQYGLPVLPCHSRSRIIGRAIKICGRAKQ